MAIHRMILPEMRQNKKRKPKDPVEMDGDERYAQDEPKKKSEPEIVII